MANRDIILDVNKIYLNFGGILAIAGVSFKVYKGEIFSIIGPNGAGKTSILNTITGIYFPSKGKILYKGKDITKMPVHKRSTMGLVRTFQNLELFKGMTVLDNLMLSRHNFLNYGLISSIFYFGKTLKQEVIHRKRVEEVIDFLNLSSYRKNMFLSYLMVFRKG